MFLKYQLGVGGCLGSFPTIATYTVEIDGMEKSDVREDRRLLEESVRVKARRPLEKQRFGAGRRPPVGVS